MGALVKATLQEITADAAAKEVGKPVSVQFNPTTLKLKLANEVEGGKSRGRQARQYVGKSSTELTLELVFDSSDEGDDEHPRPVREKTAIVEKYVLPRKAGKEAPPKLRFQWGNLILDGVVDSVDIEFDHFAADGTALRAKVTLTLKEQDSKYQFLQSGPGAKQDKATKSPLDAASSGPGAGGGPPDRVAPALGGETPADFAARMGLDPSAWRGLQVDLSAGLTLEAGIDVGFSLDLGIGGGLGIQAGVEAGVDIGVSASLGLEGGPGSGLALAAAGGVAAAAATAQAARASSAAAAAKQAFSTSASRAAGEAGPPKAAAPPRTTAAGAATTSPASAAASASAPAADRSDPRSLSFGFGVPLRPWVTGAASDRADLILGGARVRVRAPGGDPPFRDDPTTPPWVALPLTDPGRARGDATQATRRPKSCGCCGPCGHHR